MDDLLVRLSALLGKTYDFQEHPQHEQAIEALSIVTAMASAYTRGVGFVDGEPKTDIAAVIVTASARLLAHPRQISIAETLGPQSASVREGFVGFSIAEQVVLNRYRRRAA